MSGGPPVMRLGLGIATPPPLMNPEQNGLGAGETLDRLGEPGIYASEVYKIKKNGANVGVRKVARSVAGDIFGFTKKEKAFYDNIMRDPESSKYIMPYRKGNQNAASAYINFNWVDGSDLIDYINRNRTAITMEERRNIAYQTATALRWLAGADRIHRDIKADNLYRRSDGTILLIDFGLVTRLEFASTADVNLEIDNFRRFLSVLGLAEKQPLFDIEEYSSATERIIAFYDKMIRDFAPQEGGRRRRRRTTRRNKRKQSRH
jgi:serine/threonine protein kinase